MPTGSRDSEPVTASATDPIPRRLAHALDLLNFTLADVRDGLGPYLSIYLLVTHHWDQASIGLVMAIGGVAAVVAAVSAVVAVTSVHPMSEKRGARQLASSAARNLPGAVASKAAMARLTTVLLMLRSPDAERWC